MFTILLDKITSILNANTLIQEWYNFEVGELNGDPAAIVVPDDNDASYSTFSSNERNYAFSLKLLVSRSGRTLKETDKVMRDLVDSVLDDFDKDYYFSGLSTPIGYTMINVFATPSKWGYSGRDDEYRIAEIMLKCRVDVDVTKIV